MIEMIEEADEIIQHEKIQISGPESLIVKAKPETPSNEKIQLLRMQMEENRQKIADREHNKRDIQELVTQLKAKFDHNKKTMQKSSQLGRSVGDLSAFIPVAESKGKFQSASDLIGFSSHLDKERIKYLEKRLSETEMDIKNKEKKLLYNDPESDHLKVIKKLQERILDFEENIKEKECVIEARTQAVNLVSEEMSMKSKNTVDLLDDTRQEMFAMQKTFIETEEQYKEAILNLKQELAGRDLKISELTEVNDILETSRFDLTCSTSSLKIKKSELEAKCLQLNEDIVVKQNKIDELESKKEREIGDSIDDREAETDLPYRICILEDLLQESQQKCTNYEEIIKKYENDIIEKKVEYDVLNANFLVLQEKIKSMTPKPLFSLPISEPNTEIQQLQYELEQSEQNASKSQLKIIELENTIKKLTKAHPYRKISPILSAYDATKVPTDLQTIEMEDKIESHMKTIEELHGQITKLNAEKNELNRKLNNYIAENIELLDKVEKLSKDSSAESIEIVENLTQQEKLEMTQYTVDNNKKIDHKKNAINDDMDKGAMSQDLSESLVKLQEDSSILMHKIEMFTNERREVLDKMEELNAENFTYLQQIKELSTLKENLNLENISLKKEKNILQKKLKTFELEKHELKQRLKELAYNRLSLQDDINKITKEKLIEGESNRNIYLKGLNSLDAELENYRKVKDKNVKIAISKKLAKEAKNVSTLMTRLMDDFNKNLETLSILECELKAIGEAKRTAIHSIVDTLQDDFVLPDVDEIDECCKVVEKVECQQQPDNFA